MEDHALFLDLQGLYKPISREEAYEKIYQKFKTSTNNNNNNNKGPVMIHIDIKHIY